MAIYVYRYYYLYYIYFIVKHMFQVLKKQQGLGSSNANY